MILIGTLIAAGAAFELVSELRDDMGYSATDCFPHDPWPTQPSSKNRMSLFRILREEEEEESLNNKIFNQINNAKLRKV